MTRKEVNQYGYKEELRLNSHRHKRWHQGWVDGINAYVHEKGLSFPLVR